MPCLKTATHPSLEGRDQFTELTQGLCTIDIALISFWKQTERQSEQTTNTNISWGHVHVLGQSSANIGNGSHPLFCNGRGEVGKTQQRQQFGQCLNRLTGSRNRHRLFLCLRSLVVFFLAQLQSTFFLDRVLRLILGHEPYLLGLQWLLFSLLHHRFNLHGRWSGR